MRLILFDIDGTLLRDGIAAKIAFARALRDTYQTSGAIEGFSFAGMTDPECVSEIMRLAGVDERTILARRDECLRRYVELYSKHRLGAKCRQRENLDWTEACSLVQLWDDARLERLATLVLTTDDPWIAGTDRAFKIFAMKATWADDKLREWEVAHGVSA